MSSFCLDHQVEPMCNILEGVCRAGYRLDMVGLEGLSGGSSHSYRR